MAWDELLSVLDDARAETDRRDPPTACPNDGTPLITGPDSTLHCTFDGWVWVPGSN